MLELLSLLQTHRYWPGAELAQRLEVSPRTLRRDVERLRDLGYPVDAGRGVGGGYQLRAGATLPPMLLDADEAVAVAVALRTAAGGLGRRHRGGRARGAGEDRPGHAARRCGAGWTRCRSSRCRPSPAGPAVHAGDLTVLAQACRDGERVAFQYRARERPSRARGRSTRTGWWRWAGAGTWSPGTSTGPTGARSGWTGWPAARPTGARFRPREVPGGDAAQFVRTSIASRPRHDVLVELAAPARPGPARRRQLGDAGGAGSSGLPAAGAAPTPSTGWCCMLSAGGRGVHGGSTRPSWSSTWSATGAAAAARGPAGRADGGVG